MDSAQVGNRKKSNGLRMLLRMTSAVLQICIAVIFYVIVVILIIKGAKYSYNFAYQMFGDAGVEAEPGRDVKIQILKGETSMNIASKLENSKIIADRNSFYLKLKLKEYAMKPKEYGIMPGTFILNTSMSYDEVLAVITDYSKSIDNDEKTVEDAETEP